MEEGRCRVERMRPGRTCERTRLLVVLLLLSAVVVTRAGLFVADVREET